MPPLGAQQFADAAAGSERQPERGFGGVEQAGRRNLPVQGTDFVIAEYPVALDILAANLGLANGRRGVGPAFE